MRSKPTYLMERADEGERLRAKTDDSETEKQLLATGFDSLQNGALIVDAGSGVGTVAKSMLEILARQRTTASVHLLDMSEQRLFEAKEWLRPSSSIDVKPVVCDLASIPLENNVADYVFARFVFEYLSNPKEAFAELLRVVKPGGKLVIADLDYNCLTHYPIDSELQSQLNEITETLQRQQVFDPFVGRKLYQLYHRANLQDIRVHVGAHHLFYGELKKVDDMNWSLKLEQLEQLQSKGALKLGFDIKLFKDRFLTFLRSSDRFSYTPLIMVEGVKR